jgi:hypothetical protein
MFTTAALYVNHCNITDIVSTELSPTFSVFQKNPHCCIPAHHIHLDMINIITEKAAAVMTHLMLP